jgi:hypothetical protein
MHRRGRREKGSIVALALFVLLALGFFAYRLGYPLSDVLTDAATRLARGAGGVRAEGGLVSYIPTSRPEGCRGAYRLQMSQRLALVIWCKRPDGSTESSYSTTSHLNDVEVPRTWLVDKASGEATLISLEQRGGHVVVTDVR